MTTPKEWEGGRPLSSDAISFGDAVGRLRLMIGPDQRKWDLSDNDMESIRLVLQRLEMQARNIRILEDNLKATEKERLRLRDTILRVASYAQKELHP